MERYFDIMKEQLESFGYNSGDIIKYFDIDLDIADEDVVDEIDEKTYRENAVYEAFYADNLAMNKNGIVRIREVRAKKKSDDFFVVDTLDIKLTDRCTLKCEYCAASIDYLRHGEQCDNKIDQVIDDFFSFLQKVDFVRRVFFTGGEIFLYNDLNQLLTYLFKEKEYISQKCGRISIFTNGMLLPANETVRLLKENDFFVFISDYMAVKAIEKNRMTELTSLLNKNGVRYSINSYGNGWRDIQSLVSCEKAEEKSRECTNRYCSPIENGRYYRCWFLLQMCKIQAIPFSEEDSIAIGDINKDSFEKYRNGFCPGCGWCKGHNQSQRENNIVAAAHQIKECRQYKKYYE